MSIVNMFWSSVKGKFVNKTTGQAIALSSTLSTGPRFTGTQNEWNECLVETIIDAKNTAHVRDTVTLYVSPGTRKLLETSVLFKRDSAGGVIRHSSNMLLHDREGQKDEVISIIDRNGETVATVTVLDLGKKKS